ncbi:MAG: CoA transferase [Acidobacteriota bacterium]|nr:CoA transferase [Acidobacteriota bacterium]
MSSPQSAGAGPLEGLRIVDLTQMLAGPYCTMLLADLGADVVKVEPPGGDMTRYSGPFLEGDEEKAYGGYFGSINRNKRSIVLDLKSDDGKQALREMVRQAPVVVENYRAGVMERLGLSYESLRELNPALVYAAVRGFGDPRTGESPCVNWPAFDVVAQAMGGIMGITGTADGTPLKAGPGVGDIYPAALAALGIVAAVRHAERTGQGQFVDVGMVDAVLSLCERLVYEYSYHGNVPGPEGNAHPFLCPFENFQTEDGWITIAGPRDSHWKILCEEMGRPELAEDERFRTNRARVQNADETRRMVREWTSARTTDEAMSALAGKVPAGPVQTIQDIFEHPHSRSRDMLVEVEHAGTERNVVYAGLPIKYTETPGGIRRRPPRLGEHSGEIREEFNLPPAAAAGG